MRKTISFGQQEDEEVVMTGVSQETYEQVIHMFDNIKKTNFEVVTESPETLAEFVICAIGIKMFFPVVYGDFKDKDHVTALKERIIEFLNKDFDPSCGFRKGEEK